MSEEIPFTSMKITLSDEAITRLAYLRFKGSFRSNSATVEECIRVIYDIAHDIGSEIARTVRENKKFMPLSAQAETLRRNAIRMGRFIEFSEETINKLKSGEPSAGT